MQSDIRVAKSLTSELIASWTISFVTDGRDGEILLTLDHTITEKITKTIGYMDLKWIRGGQPFPVFDEPLEVIFKDSVTA